MTHSQLRKWSSGMSEMSKFPSLTPRLSTSLAERAWGDAISFPQGSYIVEGSYIVAGSYIVVGSYIVAGSYIVVGSY